RRAPDVVSRGRSDDRRGPHRRHRAQDLQPRDWRMRKYWTAYTIALQQVLQRRSSLLMDRVGGVALIISLYSVWRTLLGQKPSFLGYSPEQMISFVLAMNVLRSFVFTGRGWELVGEISSGRISSYLVRPISYHGYTLALDLARKTVHLCAAFLE